jgi:hypothetical protein
MVNVKVEAHDPEAVLTEYTAVVADMVEFVKVPEILL